MNIICSTESTSKDTIHSVNHVPQNELKSTATWNSLMNIICSTESLYNDTIHEESCHMNDELFMFLSIIFSILFSEERRHMKWWIINVFIYFFYKKRIELLMFRLINFLCSFYGTYYYYYYFNLWFCEGDSG